jgi:hypothetical protein
MNNINFDQATRFLYATLNVLLLRSPERTALGTLLGVAIHAFIKIFQPLLARLVLVDLQVVGIVEFMALGIVIIHVPNLRRFLRRGSEVGDSVEAALSTIRKAKREGMSEVAARSMYLQLCQLAVENAASKESTLRQLELIGRRRRRGRRR